MVGDGQKPNRWWVFANTDFMYFHKNEDGSTQVDLASELMEQHGISGPLEKLSAVFSTAKEAYQYAQKLYEEEMPVEPEVNRANSIFIEDRIQGEVARIELCAFLRKKWGGWDFEVDWDTIDIRKQIKKEENEEEEIAPGLVPQVADHGDRACCAGGSNLEIL
jgi:hypothetical protein